MSKTKEVRLPVTIVTKGGAVRPGDPVKLPAEEADRLIKRYGEAKGPATAAAPAGPVKPTGQALADAILEAARGLDVKNEEHFTSGGKPLVAALERRLGYDLTAEERDTAWAQIQARGGLGV